MPADTGRMAALKLTLNKAGDLVYAVLFGILATVGVWAAGGALVEATSADSATWTWSPIVLGLGICAGIAAGRQIRRRQRRR
jgi:hypothetical protein